MKLLLMKQIDRQKGRNRFCLYSSNWRKEPLEFCLIGKVKEGPIEKIFVC